MFPNITTDRVVQMARQLGYQVARQFPGIEREDIQQAALAYLNEWASKNLPNPTEDYVFGVLKRAAYRYASAERYDYMINTAQFVYTPREVRAVLSIFFDPVAWDVPSQKDDHLTATITGGTVGVSLLDVKTAMKELLPGQLDLIYRAFALEETIRDTKALSRAVDTLTKHLNRHVTRKAGDHDGPGASRSVSSSAGRHAVKHANEGEGPRYERDALDELQVEYAGVPSDPPGTHFQW